MRKVRLGVLVALGLGVLIGCSTFRDQSKAMVGGGAVAGQDYINGLTPSEKARTYFAQNASDESKAVTISRTGDGENTTGVRFVANGGVVIPPGASITFENHGYCCDPHLPAPKAGDEYQFVKTTQLIPEELQSIYRKLLTKASNGDEATLKNMQKLVWALRTAGTEAGYANNLTDQQKKILNSCSEYEGEFELYCSEKLAWSRFWKRLVAQVDSHTTINIGGVSYQASDLLDDKVGEKKIKEHLGQLVTLGESMSVEHTGFNYGELADGIYTDIKGTGSLKFKATVANSTSQNFTFYPMDYIAQVGSGVSDESASVVYFATASSTQKQRVTIIPQDEVEVEECETEEGKDSDKQKFIHALNRLLSRFPAIKQRCPEFNGDVSFDSSLPDISPANYNADRNLLTFKDKSVIEKLQSGDVETTYNVVHELSHWYHKQILEGAGYRSLSVNNLSDAEGFAVLMGMKESGYRVMANVAASAPGHSEKYTDYLRDFCTAAAVKNPTKREQFEAIASYADFTSRHPILSMFNISGSNAFRDAMSSLTLSDIVGGLRK